LTFIKTVEPVDESQPGWLGWLALLLAGFLAVIVFIPSEGRIAAPLHALVHALLGRAAFVLPLGLAFVGTLVLVRRLRPSARMPARRLAGIGAIFIAVLAIEHLLPRPADEAGTGLLGQWLSTLMLDVLGGPGASLALALLLALGVALTFDLKAALKPSGPTKQPGAES
jgi:hypothetical protein